MYFTSSIITRGYKKYNKYHFKLQLSGVGKNLKKESKILISYNRSFTLSTLQMEFCIIANEKDEKDAFGQDKKWEWAEQWEETIVNMNGGRDGKRWNHLNTWISIVFSFFVHFHFFCTSSSSWSRNCWGVFENIFLIRYL